VLWLGVEEVEDVMVERVARRAPVEDDQVTVTDGDTAFEDQLRE
jgi:hypothetical protein